MEEIPCMRGGGRRRKDMLPRWLVRLNLPRPHSYGDIQTPHTDLNVRWITISMDGTVLDKRDVRRVRLDEDG